MHGRHHGHNLHNSLGNLNYGNKLSLIRTLLLICIIFSLQEAGDVM
jgi:hypothetical protein